MITSRCRLVFLLTASSLATVLSAAEEGRSKGGKAAAAPVAGLAAKVDMSKAPSEAEIMAVGM